MLLGTQERKKEDMLVIKKELLNNPYEATIDSEGNVYVISPINGSITKYNYDGAYEFSIKDSFYYPMGVKATDFGLYVCDYGKCRLVKYDINDLSKPGVTISYVYDGDGQKALPWNAAIDSKENIYMATMDDLIKIDADGENSISLGTPACSVTIDKDDTIYKVCDGIISKVTVIGDKVEISDIVDLSSLGISSIACDSLGKIYAVDMTKNCIKVTDLSDSSIKDITGYASNPFDGIYSINIDKEDNVYLTEPDKNQVIELDKDWNYLRTFK